MNKKVQLLDEMSIDRALSRLSYEIIEKCNNPENIVLVGIKTRGIPIARRIAKKIKAHSSIDVPICELDITFYRDDLSLLNEDPKVSDSYFNLDITGKELVICDDVLYTGRTARAAIEAIFKKGRPGKISLAVLIDRGHRELPIRPDFIGKNVPTSQKEVVKVSLQETDGFDDVSLFDR